MSTITDEPALAAYDKLKSVSADAEARRLAFVRERALHDEASLLQDAREEGREQGREEGREEGREQGEREGVQKGRDKALRETTAAMIRRTDLDDQTIAAITGLDATEIAALRRVGG